MIGVPKPCANLFCLPLSLWIGCVACSSRPINFKLKLKADGLPADKLHTTNKHRYTRLVS